MPKLPQPQAVHLGYAARMEVNSIAGMPTKVFFERVMSVMDQSKYSVSKVDQEISDVEHDLASSKNFLATADPRVNEVLVTKVAYLTAKLKELKDKATTRRPT